MKVLFQDGETCDLILYPCARVTFVLLVQIFGHKMAMDRILNIFLTFGLVFVLDVLLPWVVLRFLLD